MVLGVVFVVLLPIAEVWTAIQVAHHIGWLATIALIILISACGPWLVRRQGTGVWRRARRRLEHGEVPGREAIDGVLLFIAGGLLTFPGFITGVLGLLLLLPPIRHLVRFASGAWLARKIRRSSVTIRSTIAAFDGQEPFDRPGELMTAESYPVDDAQRSLRSTKEPGQPTDRS
jgi:UPF0716 protein FxsA